LKNETETNREKGEPQRLKNSMADLQNRMGDRRQKTNR
jgi:hypothetical protein